MERLAARKSGTTVFLFLSFTKDQNVNIVEVAKKLVMDRYQLEKRKFSVFENKNKDVNKEKHTKGKCQKFQVSTPVRAVARRFLKVY